MNSALLDLGTTIHVFFNEIARFPELPNGHPGDFVGTGEHNIYILGTRQCGYRDSKR